MSEKIKGEIVKCIKSDLKEILGKSNFDHPDLIVTGGKIENRQEAYFRPKRNLDQNRKFRIGTEKFLGPVKGEAKKVKIAEFGDQKIFWDTHQAKMSNFETRSRFYKKKSGYFLKGQMGRSQQPLTGAIVVNTKDRPVLGSDQRPNFNYSQHRSTSSNGFSGQTENSKLKLDFDQIYRQQEVDHLTFQKKHTAPASHNSTSQRNSVQKSKEKELRIKFDTSQKIKHSKGTSDLLAQKTKISEGQKDIFGNEITY